MGLQWEWTVRIREQCKSSKSFKTLRVTRNIHHTGTVKTQHIKVHNNAFVLS